MTLDIEKVRRRVEEIDEKTKKVREISSLSDKEFWSDERNILSLEHLLLQMIEAVASICLHISAKKLRKGVNRVGDCFHNLFEAGIIEKDLYERLKKMNDFRNMLVHHYYKIDQKRVLKYARDEIEDFEEFTRAIGKI